MDNTVYIIGHRNPDTDAVVSAVGYATLKNLLGHSEYKAARAGHHHTRIVHLRRRGRAPIEAARRLRHRRAGRACNAMGGGREDVHGQAAR